MKNINVIKLLTKFVYFGFLITVFSDILLRTEMRTMSNERCSDRVPEADRVNVRPFHLCAEGRFGPDASNGLEDDSCQVKDISFFSYCFHKRC